MRKIAIDRINKNLKEGNQLVPNYNKYACLIIENFAKQYGYNFQHAENGGEYYIEELGYWVDGYDKDKNVVLEYDEEHHFDVNGNYLDKDINRQKEIINYLKCDFIRILYNGKIYRF